MRKTIFITAVCISSFLFLHVNVNAQSDKPYTEGPLWMISFVQTKPGMGRTYLKDLSTHWIKMGEAAKAQGLVMDYKVLSAVPASKTDWDLMLMVEVKNYAALDGLDDKMDALANKLFGTEDVQHQSALSRNDMRELLGGKLAQELIFK
jgi:hypothetical protein